jgi:hypothetical protein
MALPPTPRTVEFFGVAVRTASENTLANEATNTL